MCCQLNSLTTLIPLTQLATEYEAGCATELILMFQRTGISHSHSELIPNSSVAQSLALTLMTILYQPRYITLALDKTSFK